MGIASGNPHGGEGGGAWMWLRPKVIDRIRIAEEDPNHPEHWLHVKRTSDAEFAALLNSMRVLRMTGMMNAKPIEVYLDGKVSTVADGRRTICALRIINAESKPADRLSVRATTTKDPGVARDVNNTNHAKDPPLVLARRFVAAYSVDGNKLEAAARQGLTLKEANALERCLALPEDIQAKINNLEIPIDVALRLASNGGAEAREEITKVTDPSTGKVNPQKAREAARNAPKPSGLPTPRRLLSFRAGLDDAAKEGSPMAIARDIVDALGGNAAAKGRLPADVAQAVTLALESSRPGRKPAKAGA